MNGLKTCVAFIAGGLLGAVIAYKYQEDRYAEKCKKDIEELNAYYQMNANKSKKKEKKQVIKEEEPPKEKEEQEDVNKFKNNAEVNDYTKYSEEQIGENLERLEPYVISPLEFGEDAGFEQVSLRYYADGYVADLDLQTVDIDETIGYDSLNHFGEYEEDSVYVRNEHLLTDFEILKDSRKFKDVYSGKDESFTD